MYRAIWETTKRLTRKKGRIPLYLGILILLWMVAITAVTVTICVIFQLESSAALSTGLCAGGYAGVIFGLFGGILYLQRNLSC